MVDFLKNISTPCTTMRYCNTILVQYQYVFITLVSFSNQSEASSAREINYFSAFLDLSEARPDRGRHSVSDAPMKLSCSSVSGESYDCAMHIVGGLTQRGSALYRRGQS